MPELITVSKSAPLPVITDKIKLASQALVDYQKPDYPNHQSSAGTALPPKR